MLGFNGLSQSPSGGGVGTVAWGDITGTLSDQSDLQSALDAKLDRKNRSQTLNYFNDFGGQTGTTGDFTLSGFVKNNQYESKDYTGFIRTSNSAFCYAIRSLATVGGIFLEGGEIEIDAGIVLKTLADAVDDYIVYMGLFDDVAGTPANGVYVRYQRASATYELVTRKAGVETVVDLGITPTANDHEEFKITINAAASSIQGWANGANAGSPITTDIPTGVRLMEGIFVQRLAGTTNSKVYPDWFGLDKGFTNNRYTS